MSTLATLQSEIETRIGTVVAAVSGFEAAALSEEPYDFIRKPGHSPRHLEFAVGFPRSVAAANSPRQIPANGVFTKHQLRIVAWFQLSPKDRPTSYRTSLDFEAAIRNAIIANGWCSAAHFVWESSSRDAQNIDGWMFLDQQFEMTHYLPLT